MNFVRQEMTDREIEIAAYLLQSFSLKQISERTGLSKKTLLAHIRNMQEKLGVENSILLQKIFKIHSKYN